jgi:hypothetical protein
MKEGENNIPGMKESLSSDYVTVLEGLFFLYTNPRQARLSCLSRKFSEPDRGGKAIS